jgi:hypothetical protein
MLASGAIVAPALLIPRKTFFLPPSAGWISPIAKVDISNLEYPSYMAGIRSGKYSYEKIPHKPTFEYPGFADERGTISMWWEDPVELDGKFHSQYTGRAYDWDFDEVDVIDGLSRRAIVDDNLKPDGIERFELDRQRRIAGLDRFGNPMYRKAVATEVIIDTELNAAQEACRALAAKRAAQIRAMMA